MKFLKLLGLALIFSGSLAQAQPDLEKVADSILNEATMMYKLERAAWVSTDILMADFGKKYIRKNVGGYLSYFKGDTIKTIYWKHKDGDLFINNTFNFQNDYSVAGLEHDHEQRKPTEKEMQLISVRNKLLADMAKNPYVYYKPQGSDYNFLLTEKPDGYRMYIFVGFKNKEVVPFGNDYQIEIDADGNVTKRKRLHKSYLETPYTGGYKFKDQEMTEVMHTHLKDSPFITATDICLAMLYTEFVEWGKVTTITDYISTYNLRDGTLSIVVYDPDKE